MPPKSVSSSRERALLSSPFQAKLGPSVTFFANLASHLLTIHVSWALVQPHHHVPSILQCPRAPAAPLEDRVSHSAHPKNIPPLCLEPFLCSHCSQVKLLDVAYGSFAIIADTYMAITVCPSTALSPSILLTRVTFPKPGEAGTVVIPILR